VLFLGIANISPKSAFAQAVGNVRFWDLLIPFRLEIPFVTTGNR
jgi:hypothetical protein